MVQVTFEVAFSPRGFEILLALGRVAPVPVSAPILYHSMLDVRRWCLFREGFLVRHVWHRPTANVQDRGRMNPDRSH
jgi:hypothetical protein